MKQNYTLIQKFQKGNINTWLLGLLMQSHIGRTGFTCFFTFLFTVKSGPPFYPNRNLIRYGLFLDWLMRMYNTNDGSENW